MRHLRPSILGSGMYLNLAYQVPQGFVCAFESISRQGHFVMYAQVADFLVVEFLCLVIALDAGKHSANGLIDLGHVALVGDDDPHSGLVANLIVDRAPEIKAPLPLLAYRLLEQTRDGLGAPVRAASNTGQF